MNTNHIFDPAANPPFVTLCGLENIPMRRMTQIRVIIHYVIYDANVPIVCENCLKSQKFIRQVKWKRLFIRD